MFESFQRNNDSKQQNIFNKKIFGNATFEQMFKRFSAGNCNITNVLQNWKISLKRGFDSDILLKCELEI